MNQSAQDGRRLGSAPKRVVVVDDSKTIRSWLCQVIGSDPRLEVVGEAADALEARSVIKQTNPDVITLDIEMPGMSGLEFLKRLITLRPMPVVMVSSLTERGSDAAIRALSLGAVDCIVKPHNVMDQKAQRNLTRRIYSAALCQISGPPSTPAAIRSHSVATGQPGRQIVLIGASTGGVGALEVVIGGLDPQGPPVVIVQHMPGPFLSSFANRLNDNFPQDVGLLDEDVPLSYGQVRLARGHGQHSLFGAPELGWKTTVRPREPADLHCPSVDALFHSAVRQARNVTAVILTGLGKDGAEGLKALRDGGAHTIGQDKASSVVYGMPRAAAELGAVAECLHLNDIAAAINQHTSRNISVQGAKS